MNLVKNKKIFQNPNQKIQSPKIQTISESYATVLTYLSKSNKTDTKCITQKKVIIFGWLIIITELLKKIQ